MNFLKFAILSLLISTAYASDSNPGPIKPETMQKLIDLRAKIDKWAPMCEGVVALSRDCYQFDMIEFTGFRCVTGDTERCQDIKKAQAEDGRWWRAPRLINQTTENSFSRDMFMGLMFYFTTTKDADSLKKWMDWLGKNRNKMCDDGTDNRCSLLPSTWGLLGETYKHLGLKRTTKMKIGAQILPGEMYLSALTAPKGFQLVLVADNLTFLRSIGHNTTWMKAVAKQLYRRQPHNPLIQYLHQGATEELAHNIIEACPETESERLDDIFWQRELGRNAQGELIIIRDSWGPQNSRIPVRTMANGHDCLVLLNLAIRQPF